MKIDRGFIIRLYPRKWRERYGDELAALLDDRSMNFRDGVDLLVNCAREWSRTLRLARIFLPIAGAFAANATGWWLQDTFGRLPLVDAMFPKTLFIWLGVLVLICVRLAPSYWRWLSAPLHREPPPFPHLSRIEGRFVVAVAVITGVIVPWNTNMPREWWSFGSNPFLSMWPLVQMGIWRPEDEPPFESTVSCPPTHPLGLA